MIASDDLERQLTQWLADVADASRRRARGRLRTNAFHEPADAVVESGRLAFRAHGPSRRPGPPVLVRATPRRPGDRRTRRRHAGQRVAAAAPAADRSSPDGSLRIFDRAWHLRGRARRDGSHAAREWSPARTSLVPDGTRLAYWSVADSVRQSSLDVMDVGSSVSIPMAGGRTFYVQDPAVWSPDGNRLAFTTTTGELRLVNSDGSNLQRIGDPAMRFGIPTWSPDGTWIAVRVEMDPGCTADM